MATTQTSATKTRKGTRNVGKGKAAAMLSRRPRALSLLGGISVNDDNQVIVGGHELTKAQVRQAYQWFQSAYSFLGMKPRKSIH